MESLENSFETPKGCLSCSIRLGNHFFPNWKQKTFFGLKNSDFFFRKMLHSAQNPKSSMLAKRFVSSKT